VLFRQDILKAIADGRVTLAIRRWRKAPPRAGATLRSPVGVISLDHVTVIEDGDITVDDIRRTGMTREALAASIRGEGTLLRIELRLIGDDPRVALRESTPTSDEIRQIRSRLERIDASSPAPWTARYLQIIARQPAVVARRLAPQVTEDLARFKRRVRQLKDLGLTESLEVGYRLSPRGLAVLESFE